MRPAFVVVLSGAALAAAASASSAPTAVETRSCSQAGPFFNVQITGNIAGTYVNWLHPELFSPIPRGEAMVAIWSFGSQRNREPALYGWATGSRTDIAERCRAPAMRRRPDGALGPALRVKDGWAFGRRYECDRRGRVVIRTDERVSRTRVAVWMEKSRELIAVAELRRGSGWLRISKRCAEKPN